MHTVADPHKKPAFSSPLRKRKGLLIFLLVVVAVLGTIVYPPSFLFVMRQLLAVEAWRHGFRLSIGKLDGSVTDPVWLYDASLSHSSEAGTSTLLEIDKARATFAWEHLFWQRDVPVWRSLTLDGVRGDIELPVVSAPGGDGSASPQGRAGSSKRLRLMLPTSLTVHHANVVIRQKEGAVRLEDLDLQASTAEAGQVVIGAISVQEPWMTSVFSNCRGALRLEGSRLILEGMKLTDSLSIMSASADLPELLRGQVEMAFALDAFSGNIEGELRSSSREQHLVFDGNGTFANISVAQLGAFLGQDADGTIQAGKFSFRGSPRELAKATFTTRFEAGAFRWGARRWNSLVAGATYVHHRLEKLQFQLTQADNSLELNGDMDVPDSWNVWWKTDFNFQVAAKINNLSELSALLGPGFGDIYGKLTVDGSVSGDNASFNGQLAVSGSHLSFRKAPLDQLQAAIKLNGNEIQVTHAEFTHGKDYLRGDGVVNILGEKRYWGEVKASVADLALYASFLQPPVAPEAFSGGLMLDWSGDGAQGAHSGAFTVRLNRIRPLVSGSAGAAAWEPVDVNAEATYSPDSIFFTSLSLANGETSVASRVVATPSSLTLQGLKLLHGKATWLTGDAQIPLNVWAAWQNPGTAAWWNFNSPCKLNVALNRLSVRETLLLSGHDQPFDGELTGNLKGDGTLAKLKADGHLAVKNAAAVTPEGTLKAGNAVLDFKGNQLTVTSAAGVWNTMALMASGTATASDLRSPALDLEVKLPDAPLALAKGLDAATALDLRATGQPGSLALSGSAELETLNIDRGATIESLVGNGGSGLVQPPPAPALAGPSGWTLNVHVGGNAAVNLANTSGTMMPALEVSGSLAQPVIAGSIAVKGFKIAEGPDQISITDGTYFLGGPGSGGTSLVLHATGVTGGDPFDGYIYGTLADKHFTWGPEVTDALAGGADVSASPALPTLPLWPAPVGADTTQPTIPPLTPARR